MGDPADLEPTSECELHKKQILENGHVCQIADPEEIEDCEIHDVANGATVGINMCDDVNMES